jgi:hypothetical protein
MKKGIGPRGLGAPKSAAKMYGKSPAKKMTDPPKKQDYYNLRPEDAKTYADSAAVETRYFSGSRAMGEVAGKVASGGGLSKDKQRFEQGTTPNSPEAKKMMKDMRDLAKRTGKGSYRDAYNK